MRKEYFKKLQGSSLICLKNINDLYLKGGPDSFDKITFRLKISKCHDEPGEIKKCASESEINEFIDFMMIIKHHQTD